MWVLKIGGSLSTWPGLVHWLAEAVDLPVVIVPGGGPFADQVRSAQAHWQFDDAAAHRMALLAMEQTGRMLCALNTGLQPLESFRAIEKRSARGLVWMPSMDVLSDPVIEQDWSVTSDSLALYLAYRIKADGVLLVKSAAVLPGRRSIERLQSEQLIDEAAHRYRPACPVGLVNREHFAELAGLIQANRAGGDVCWISIRGEDHCKRTADKALAM